MVDTSYGSVIVQSIAPSSDSSVSSAVTRKPPPAPAVAAITSHTSTMGDKNPNKSQTLVETGNDHKNISNTKRVWTGLVAGAMAGAIAKTVIAPLDRTKIFFQIQKTPYSVKGALAFLQGTVAKEGVLGLWRGNSASMARILPYSAIQFASHEQWRGVLGLNVTSPVDHSEDAHVKRFLAGSLAGVTSQSLTYPLDLARARMAVTNKGMYDSLLSVFRTMWRQESILAFYRGYLPTLLGVIPYAGLSFLTYDTLQHHYRVNLGDGTPNPLVNLAFGAAAGVTSQTGSYPLDILRRRMQTAQVTGEQYNSIIGSLRKIYVEEGLIRGFYKGLSMNWVKGPVAFGISFASNEFFKDHLRRIA